MPLLLLLLSPGNAAGHGQNRSGCLCTRWPVVFVFSSVENFSRKPIREPLVTHLQPRTFKNPARLRCGSAVWGEEAAPCCEDSHPDTIIAILSFNIFELCPGSFPTASHEIAEMMQRNDWIHG
eukprot:s368_g27.t1